MSGEVGAFFIFFIRMTLVTAAFAAAAALCALPAGHLLADHDIRQGNCYAIKHRFSGQLISQHMF